MQPEIYKYFMGLDSRTAFSRSEEFAVVQASPYRWWWEYLRISPLLWYSDHAGTWPTDAGLAKVYESVGRITETSFAAWWVGTGTNVFSESIAPKDVRVVPQNDESPPDSRINDHILTVQIPLYLRREKILKQIRAVLDAHHEGRMRDPTKYSTAQLKLFTRRYRLNVLETEYWVLLYSMVYPKVPKWVIADMLRLSPHLKVRSRDSDEGRSAIRQLSSIAGRHLAKARGMLVNAAYGDFPKSSLSVTRRGAVPFRADRVKEYKKLTLPGPCGERSTFNKWVVENFENRLLNEIFRRHHPQADKPIAMADLPLAFVNRVRNT